MTALLRFGGTTIDQLTAAIVDIAALADGRPALAARLADRLGERTAGRSPIAVDPDLLLHTAHALAPRGEATTGLFAVVLTQLGRSFGCSEAWRELLHDLRRHPVADVRDLAFAITMQPR